MAASLLQATGSGHAAVVIGRFQPVHRGHVALLQRALASAPYCVVVLGSARQARTPRNPFTWEERRELVRMAVAPHERERLLFLPVRDYYDDMRWAEAVRSGVASLLADRDPACGSDVVLIGHFGDAGGEDLHGFPEWRPVNMERVVGVSGAAIRDAYFHVAGRDVDAALAAVASQAPPGTIEFLRAWSVQPQYAEVAQEWEVLRRYKTQWSEAPYPPVFVTADAVVRCAAHVLLIRRGRPPGKGLYAVPGGFIEQRETTYQCALRELMEETHLHLLGQTMRQALRAVAVFDHPDRSQRGRTITHAHYFDLGQRELPEVRAGDDAGDAQWVPIERLAALEDRFHDDHFHMLDHFLGLTGA
ncbi:MAG TPA: NUDIX domain-containing protein [Albitalea sp.]|nr:NUDIX domain-containing protein [Albitalea sp.]